MQNLQKISSKSRLPSLELEEETMLKTHQYLIFAEKSQIKIAGGPIEKMII